MFYVNNSVHLFFSTITFVADTFQLSPTPLLGANGIQDGDPGIREQSSVIEQLKDEDIALPLSPVRNLDFDELRQHSSSATGGTGGGGDSKINGIAANGKKTKGGGLFSKGKNMLKKLSR